MRPAIQRLLWPYVEELAGDGALCVSGLVTRTGVSPATAKRLLRELHLAGHLVELPRGHRKGGGQSPHFYAVAPEQQATGEGEGNGREESPG